MTTPRARTSTAAQPWWQTFGAGFASLVLAVLLGTGCSSEAEADRSDNSSDAPPATTADDEQTEAAPSDHGAPPEPELFEGSDDDFYVVPDPVPAGDPGDLIRYQIVGTQDQTDGYNRTTVRVMYHSEDASGADRAVTGIVTYPDAAGPEGGWPVVSYAHGTAGMATMCAPSRDGRAAPGWGVEGVWAATDYVGLGPIGEIHPYLSKPSEGNAVIDIVTAAAQLPDSGAGKRWVGVGHSQGGHAALAAHELAAERAPEPELVATAAIAPGVGIDISYGVDEQLMTVLTMMQLYGGATEHDDIDIGDYLTGEAVEDAEIFRTGCVDEIVFELTPTVVTEPFEVDPWITEPAASMLRGNRVGTRAVADVPVFLASGNDDLTVVPARVSDFFDKLCALGQPTVMREVRDADHGSIIALVSNEVGEFLNSALDNSAIDNSAPVPDDCP